MSRIPNQVPLVRPQSGDLPNTDSMASATREERRSAKKLAQFFREQYENFLPLRRDHALNWMRVSAIMAGYHWFRLTKTGGLQLLGKPKDPKIVRATVPLMKPMRKWELGRMNSTQVGISARPITGSGVQSFWLAERAEILLNSWAEEADLPGFDDELNQQLIHYGLSGIYPYVHTKPDGSRVVRIKAIPAPELFPIPYTARNWSELDGIQHITFASKAWLEAMDEEYEREHGQAPEKTLASASGSVEPGLHVNSPLLGVRGVNMETQDGAVVSNIWMKPTKQVPGGEWFLMAGDEIHRYRGGIDPQTGRSLVLQNDELPIHPVYYNSDPEDFLGSGFLEDLISPQLEKNRQMSSLIQSSLNNQQMLIFDPDMVDLKDIQNSPSGLIQAQSGSLQDGGTPVYKVDPSQITRDQIAMIEMVDRAAEKAAGYESKIIYGQSEGRVDSGSANTMLNHNAQIPLQSVMDNKFRAYKRVFPRVLDLIGQNWSGEKRVRVLGTQNMGREETFNQDNLPTSEQAIITPNPMLAGGRNTLSQILFQMRQMPTQDGGFEVESYEFRKALKLLDMSPPGLDDSNPEEQRIEERIAMLVNDGQMPGTPPAGAGDRVIDAQQGVENHRLAVELLRRKILSSSFGMYGPNVQQALIAEMRFHHTFTYGAMQHPDAFDDDLADADAAAAEKYLDAAENDLASNEGHLTMNGIPIGV
jgi:hypothetical protein